MIFKMKMLFAAAVLTVGFAPTAFATDPGNNSGAGAGITLDAMGSAAIGGNLNSVFGGVSGSNQLNKWGNTHTNVESSLTGFCDGNDCSSADLKMNLKASQGGDAWTQAESDDSGTDVMAKNAGVFQSNVNGGINFRDQSSEFGIQGGAAFANSAEIKATGDNVHSTMETYGSGVSNSDLNLSGNGCIDCTDLNGQTTSQATSGMDFTSMANGSSPGAAISITNSGRSESATSMQSFFNKNASE